MPARKPRMGLDMPRYALGQLAVVLIILAALEGLAVLWLAR